MSSDQIAVRHHFVPQWYQRGFLPEGKGEFYVFDKSPVSEIECPDGRKRRIAKPKEIRRTGTAELFQREHLYALSLPYISPDFLEKRLFGAVDHVGAIANQMLLKWPITIPMPNGEDYPYDWGNPNDRLLELLWFINAQKTRTPRGLEIIRRQLSKAGVAEDDNNIAMWLFAENQNRLCTIWTEAHWEIYGVDASSTVKFLLSDDPVTFYNMDCYPQSAHCRYPNDPSPFWRGTRVLFPLSADKLLVLSHKEHMDSPKRSKAKQFRRNARVFDNAIFSFTWITHSRILTSDEATEVNRILKSRAVRFVAAHNADNLYPEHSETKRKWSDLDSLFQPTHPSSHTSSEVHFGFTDGTSKAFNAYGEEIEPETEQMRARLEKLLRREGITTPNDES